MNKKRIWILLLNIISLFFLKSWYQIFVLQKDIWFFSKLRGLMLILPVLFSILPAIIIICIYFSQRKLNGVWMTPVFLLGGIMMLLAAFFAGA